MASKATKITRSSYLLTTKFLQGWHSNTKHWKQIPGILHEDKLPGSGWHRIHSATSLSKIITRKDMSNISKLQQHRFFHATNWRDNKNESRNTEIVKNDHNTEVSSSILNMEDESLFSEFSTQELTDTLFYLSLISCQSVAMTISKYADYNGPLMHAAYSHYSAGESVGDVSVVLHRLRDLGLKGILNYSAQGAVDNAACDSNLNHFLGTVSSMFLLPPGSVSFLCLKMTALCTPELLERVSHLLIWQHRHPEFNLPWKRETLPILVPSSPDHHNTEPQPLSSNEEMDLNLAEQRLFQLCGACEAASVPLLVDAEYTIVQPAIDYLVYSAFSQFNRSPGKPVVYVTVQAYLKDSLSRLFVASEEAKKRGISMGVKLVSGAYIFMENAIAKSSGVVFPLHSSITEIRNCYNACSSLVLEMVAKGEASLLVATHNIDSAKSAAAKAEELGIEKRGGGLQFAQLKGMADSLSLGLSKAGFEVSKFLPFGSIRVVMPYLMSRRDESHAMIIQDTSDMERIRKELQRRLQNS